MQNFIFGTLLLKFPQSVLNRLSHSLQTVRSKHEFLMDVSSLEILNYEDGCLEIFMIQTTCEKVKDKLVPPNHLYFAKQINYLNNSKSRLQRNEPSSKTMLMNSSDQSEFL